MIFVCPNPHVWHVIYTALNEAWKAAGSVGDPPPIPLILNGWAFSDDFDKRIRWQDTVEWASRHGLETLIPTIEEADQYRVAELSNVLYPQFGDQREPAKTRPSEEQVRAALECLKAQWSAVAGNELCQHTLPLRFTGRKKRRLLVLADPGYSPPWGSWHWITKNRQEFSRFRKSVNRALAPLEIDHIDFRTDTWHREVPKGLGEEAT